MNDVGGEGQFTNRCACGWEVRGSEDRVVDATIDHGRRIHNMDATRDEVLAAVRAGKTDGDATVDARAVAPE
jgi:predicted small metal-binding protein